MGNMKIFRQIVMDEEGLSLIELLAVVVVSAILFVSTMQVLNSVMAITRKQTLQAECQQTANILVAQMTTMLKNNQGLTIEDNNTAEISLVNKSGGRKTIRLTNSHNRILIDREEINPTLIVTTPEGGSKKNYRENNTELNVVLVEFFDNDSQLIYARRVDLTTYVEKESKGWW